MGNIADDTQWLDATDQAALIANGEVSAVEMVDGAAERIDRIDGDLNAIVMRWYDRARTQAKALDGARSGSDNRSGSGARAPFAGVPFLLKDLGAHDAGMPMTSGNKAMRDAQPISERDATIVTRFRDAGLVTLGRTSSPELGSLPVTEPTAYGPTRNPWDTSRTPGGSSGGAAAAVSAGMVSIAHASDGGGSIRIPAACSGLVGLKTTQGRITMGPYANESGLSVSFCVSRSVRDSAQLLDAVHGPGVGDTVVAPAPTRPYIQEVGSNPDRLKIGLLDTHPIGNALHDDCITAVRSVATMLEGLGHDVSLSHPSALEDKSFTPRFMAMWSTMMAVSIDAMGESIGRTLTEDDVETVNWALARHADSVTSVEYAEALAAVSEYRRAMHSWWTDGWDLLLTPTLCEPPVKIGEHDSTAADPMAGMRRAAEFIAFTPPFNASGQPGISLPLHWNDDGLPIGVQLVAAYGREDLLLAVASQLEAAHPWADRRPVIC